jgi:flagellar FliJ protein
MNVIENNMTKPSAAIHTLQELAQRESEIAATELVKRKNKLLADENQLHLLREYREEYVSQNFVMMISGVQSSELTNFRAFLLNLDKTIVSQRQIIDQSALALQEQQGIWQECERKKMSYKILSEQEKRKILAEESKRDQKMTDEFVNSRSAVNAQKSKV